MIMPHPVDVTVGNRVREFRIRKGLSQQALGERVGVSFQQIQKYERGTNRMGSSRLV
ncbi:MAG: helix-turn-helix transcriptional regulator [Alphaproteobacteria bacterium]|nr:helix-turn-helix transcriptional regulator [Alphaproteobacteria bacterium]